MRKKKTVFPVMDIHGLFLDGSRDLYYSRKQDSTIRIQNMKRMELIAPCHFGLEAVVKREIRDLGYEIKQVEDGKVTFEGDAEAVARANMFLRTPERILIKAGQFHAASFEELFENTRSLPWEDFLEPDARFWVTKATFAKSRLASAPDIQSVVKKAMVERMKQKYRIHWFPETGAGYPVRVFIYKDQVTIALDSSGESLHRRGYRKLKSRAPLQENLAAALIMLTPWNKDRILVDPFCGSGTFPIEAAMIGTRMAPGRNRSFAGEQWRNLVPKKEWYAAAEEAEELMLRNIRMDIQGYDIDGKIIRTARINAAEAGVEQYIHFQQRPVSQLSHPKKYGFVITNPPYGQRLEDLSEMPALYREMGQAFRRLDCWSEFVLTAYEDAEKYIGKKADKNRKLYNGMIKTYYYQFLGPRPPKPGKEA